MTASRKRATRAGDTEKLSVSLDRADVIFLRRRAARLHGGNLSAALAEGVRRIHEEEGREALSAWLGEAGRATPSERHAIRAEWTQETSTPAPRRKRR
jgi:hypothetical protein